MNLITIVEGLLKSSGYATMTWQQLVMLVISFILMYLAIVKQFEPLLLLPISFGIFMSNLPHSGTFEYFYQLDHWYDAGVLGVMYMGVKSSFFPCMMFLAVGAMTDFGPLIAKPDFPSARRGGTAWNLLRIHLCECDRTVHPAAGSGNRHHRRR